MKKYKIIVFGKEGCQKCSVLKTRLTKVLKKEEYSDFEMEYAGVDETDGLVKFAMAECINPQRIPAFIIQQLNKNNEYEYVPVKDPCKGADPVCGNSKLYQYLGIQTDYTEIGRGLISGKMIEYILDIAKS